MDPTVFELNGIGLCLQPTTLNFLCGINPEERWKSRGLTGHTQNKSLIEDLEKQEAEAVHQLTHSPEGHKKIQDFGSECRDVMRSILLGNYAWLDKYLDNREFVLLCGLHRSGGTYLLDEISSVLNFPYQKYHCMHDDLPSFFPILYWRSPNYFLQYIAEVAQFLVIVKRSVPWKIVVKKRAIWTFAIESLMPILRERLSVFVHVRHPVSWAWADTELREGKGQSADITVAGSMKQYVEIYDGTLKGDESAIRLMMRFWRLFHLESARKGANISVLPFGRSTDALKRFGAQRKKGYEPSAFNPTPRDYSRYQEHFPEAQEIIDEVRQQWSLRGQTFPNIELL